MIQIASVTFVDGAAVVQYMDTATDVRVKGSVVLQHQITLSAQHPDYRDDIESLHHKVSRIVANALEDFAESEPVEPRDLDGPSEEEQEQGMGHG